MATTTKTFAESITRIFRGITWIIDPVGDIDPQDPEGPRTATATVEYGKYGTVHLYACDDGYWQIRTHSGIGRTYNGVATDHRLEFALRTATARLQRMNP